jgi:hypothetical protein
VLLDCAALVKIAIARQICPLVDRHLAVAFYNLTTASIQRGKNETDGARQGWERSRRRAFMCSLIVNAKMNDIAIRPGWQMSLS